MLTKLELNRKMQGKDKIYVPEQFVPTSKSKSLNVTNEEKFKPVKGDLMTYSDSLEPRGYDNPKITLIVSENLKQHQKGLVRLVINEKGQKKHYIFHMDGIMSCIYAAYAPEIKELQEMLKKRSEK